MILYNKCLLKIYKKNVLCNKCLYKIYMYNLYKMYRRMNMNYFSLKGIFLG